MADYEIKIVSADITTGKLVLDPPGDVMVRKEKKVRWSITAPNVRSFYIENKDSRDKVFSFWNPPPKFYVKSGTAKVKDDAEDYAEFNYCIHWKDLQGNPHQSDPKISVMPSDLLGLVGKKDDSIKKIIIPLLLIGAGLLALALLSRKESKKSIKKFRQHF